MTDPNYNRFYFVCQVADGSGGMNSGALSDFDLIYKNAQKKDGGFQFVTDPGFSDDELGAELISDTYFNSAVMGDAATLITNSKGTKADCGTYAQNRLFVGIINKIYISEVGKTDALNTMNIP